MCKEFCGNSSVPFKTVGQLIDAGKKLPELEPLKWEKGQGARQTAYLCYSSGTSGLPVSRMMTLLLGVFPFYDIISAESRLLT
jgi:acyl-CoA synthetase (AMP-forming)/AMP-acid ligase II